MCLRRASVVRTRPARTVAELVQPSLVQRASVQGAITSCVADTHNVPSIRIR